MTWAVIASATFPLLVTGILFLYWRRRPQFDLEVQLHQLKAERLELDALRASWVKERQEFVARLQQLEAVRAEEERKREEQAAAELTALMERFEQLGAARVSEDDRERANRELIASMQHLHVARKDLRVARIQSLEELVSLRMDARWREAVQFQVDASATGTALVDDVIDQLKTLRPEPRKA